MRYLWLCASLILLEGCSSKAHRTLDGLYTQKSDHYRQLQFSQKMELRDQNSGTVTLFVSVDYLYDLSEAQHNESFLLLCYDENQSQECRKLPNELLLNGSKPIKVELITSDNPYVIRSPFVTSWGLFYQVVFPSVQSDKLQLLLRKTNTTIATFDFLKTPKYIQK